MGVFFKKSKKLTTSKSQTGYKGKNLTVVHYTHIVWNECSKVVRLRELEEDKRGGE